MQNNDRYDRQSRVPGFSGVALSKLENAKVLIVGAGGLGFAVAAQLAGAGIGYIEIIDDDVVSLSNLHRQWLYKEQDLGKPKVKCLAQHLRQLNSQITIADHHQRLSSSNAFMLVESADLVIDAADNFATSYLLDQVCVATNSKAALLSASVNQLYGYIGIFCSDNSPSFRTVFPRIPAQQTSCDSVGVTGPAVAVVAGLQAQAALDFLVGSSASLTGKLLYVDLRNYSFNLLDCRKLKETEHNTTLFISPSDIAADDWVIDVRSENETLQRPQPFHVNQNLPLENITTNSIKADNQQRLVFSCQSGQRALSAALKLSQLQINSQSQKLSYWKDIAILLPA